jgi:N6-L-threonylcarbamoyladenine synthase
VARGVLQAAGIESSDVDAVAATQGPGLPNALLIGFKAGQAMAFALGKPFVGVNHHEAHLYSPWISGETADFGAFKPNVSLIVSGGHTILVHVRGELEHKIIGSTVDDAAGECFDKVGKLIGLPYPGGPEVDRLASEGNASAYQFPRPMLRERNDDFSFAGLKTSVRYFLQKNPDLVEDEKRRRDLCASVQAAIVEVLVTKTVRAAQRIGVRCITASGGVTCNSRLRQELESACRANGFSLRLAERKFCTDNAAMIGLLAERKLLRGTAPSPLDEDAMPAMRLA